MGKKFNIKIGCNLPKNLIVMEFDKEVKWISFTKAEITNIINILLEKVKILELKDNEPKASA